MVCALSESKVSQKVNAIKLSRKPSVKVKVDLKKLTECMPLCIPFQVYH